MKRRIISIAVAIALAVFTATVAGAQVPISGLPSASPAGADTVPIVHSGVTSRTTISAILGLSTAVSTIAVGSNLTGGGAGPTPPPIAVASPAATAVPTTCTGWSATFVLQKFTCPAAGSNIAFSATNVISVASPAPTAVPSSCAGWDLSFNLQSFACTSGVTAGPNINIVAGLVSVASPTPTSVPSSCAGWTATLVLTTQPCVVATGSVGTAGSNINITTGVISVASPTATLVPTNCSGWSSTFVLQIISGACAIVGINKTTFQVMAAPTATALATGEYTRAVQISTDISKPTVDGLFGYCDSAGSGAGLVTVKAYVNYGLAPTFSTANPVATAVSWPTGSSLGGGATFAPTALPTSTTPGNPTWVFFHIEGIPAAAPSGLCSFQLQGFQVIQ